MDTQKQIKSALLKYIDIPEDIDRLAGIATMDLYFGPYGTKDLENDGDDIYTSFSDAINKIRDWKNNNLPSELYIDLDCDYVSDKEPEGYEDEETGEYIEPYLENTYKLSGNEILRAIWDKELVSYL